MTQITVTFERKLTDGNYGSEGVTASWTHDIDDDGDSGSEVYVAAHMLLKSFVLGALAESAAQQVSFVARKELQAHDKDLEQQESLEDLPL